MFNTTHVTKELHNHIHYPDTIKEVKAPTDESIRLLNEMQQKLIDNIVAKIEVNDNVMKGECYLIDTASMGYRHRFMFVMKFSINQQEFVVEKQIHDDDITWQDNQNIREISAKVKSYTNAIMFWFACKKLPSIVYEQITNSPAPKGFMTRNMQQ